MDSQGLISSPLLQIVSEDLLISRDIFFNRDRKPGIVEEMPPIDIVTGHVAGPGSAAQALGPRLAIVPASGVDKAVGHIALYPAYVGLHGKLLHAVFSVSVD